MVIFQGVAAASCLLFKKIVRGVERKQPEWWSHMDEHWNETWLFTIRIVQICKTSMFSRILVTSLQHILIIRYYSLHNFVYIPNIVFSQFRFFYLLKIGNTNHQPTYWHVLSLWKNAEFHSGLERCSFEALELSSPPERPKKIDASPIGSMWRLSIYLHICPYKSTKYG